MEERIGSKRRTNVTRPWRRPALPLEPRFPPRLRGRGRDRETKVVASMLPEESITSHTIAIIITPPQSYSLMMFLMGSRRYTNNPTNQHLSKSCSDESTVLFSLRTPDLKVYLVRRLPSSLRKNLLRRGHSRYLSPAHSEGLHRAVAEATSAPMRTRKKT